MAGHVPNYPQNETITDPKDELAVQVPDPEEHPNINATELSIPAEEPTPEEIFSGKAKNAPNEIVAATDDDDSEDEAPASAND